MRVLGHTPSSRCSTRSPACSATPQCVALAEGCDRAYIAVDLLPAPQEMIAIHRVNKREKDAKEPKGGSD